MARRVLRQMMREPGMLFGLWQSILDPDVTELIGAAGYDYIVLDMEHNARGIESARTCILAANAADVPMVARVGERDQQFMVEQLLEAGAQGVLVPTVETKEQAIHAVRSARFAPEGERGSSSYVPVRRWLHADGAAELRALSNRSVLVGVIVETPLGFENLDDMLTVDGVDAWMMGPGDLSARLGLAMGDPRVVDMVEGAFRKVAAAGRVSWAATGDPSRLASLGVKMTLIGSDHQAIAETRAQLVAGRSSRPGTAASSLHRDEA